MALPLAVFFELFWLDLYPIGSYLPPMGIFPYLLLLALSGVFGWNGPASIAFPLAMALPFAYVIPYIEYRQRDHQKNASNRLIDETEKKTSLDGLPAALIRASSLQQITVCLLLFLVVYAGLSLICSMALMKDHPDLVPLDVNWSVLYAIAALGAVLSLRIRRIYLVFGVCMLATLLLKFSL